MRCRHFGATGIWANDETTAELEHKKEVCSAHLSISSLLPKSKVFTRYPSRIGRLTLVEAGKSDPSVDKLTGLSAAVFNW